MIKDNHLACAGDEGLTLAEAIERVRGVLAAAYVIPAVVGARDLLALQARVPQMFTQVLVIELTTHYAAWDLTGVKQVAEKLAPLAARNPGWRALLQLADGHHRRLRGDLQGARQAYEQTLLMCTPDAAQPERAIRREAARA